MKISPTDIVSEVKKVLTGGRTGKGRTPVFMTSYQLLEELPPSVRSRIIHDWGQPGLANGSSYTAVGVVAKAAEMAGAEKSFIETRHLKFMVDSKEVYGGFEVCAVYRLTATPTDEESNSTPPQE